VVNRSQHAPRHIELLDFAKDTVAAYPNGTSLGNSAHIDALMGHFDDLATFEREKQTWLILMPVSSGTS
jgi:hypothetical protein